ncbi:MAG: four helix bundle protein [Candidatus Paceibacterota bacterium]|jgi:four helix bundle protein
MENKQKIQKFTDLNVWKEGHELVLSVYQITRKFPKEELFSLTNQIRRAAISITSNIAEGFSRQGYKEKLQFYYMALGSLTEIQNQLLIARDLKYLNQAEFNRITEQATTVHKLLNAFISKTKSILNSKF